MKVTEYFEQANDQTLISFEVLPPLKGGRMQDIFAALDPLMEFKPPFIDVTYHREEYIYNKRKSGYYEKTAIRKRPGTVGICASIMHRYGVDAVPHLICGGFTTEDTENALIDLNFLNVDNVLALRGDARKFEGKFIPEEGGHAYALDLVRQVVDMNNGKYLDANIDNGAATDFCIGIAGYPEKHFESPNLELDLEYTKAKIDAGANYIVTQMFFDKKSLQVIAGNQPAWIAYSTTDDMRRGDRQLELKDIFATMRWESAEQEQHAWERVTTILLCVFCNGLSWFESLRLLIC